MAYRKLSEDDVFKTFRTSYKLKFNWNNLLHTELSKWMDDYEMSTNCSENMIYPSLMSLTSSLCGPHTTVSSNGTGFETTLNTYNFVISPPGGGKSNTYKRIVEPVIERVEERHGKKICLETYTTAGIQTHQSANGGYGIITGDEGERFLSTILPKQKNGESERALLNKMWNGKGDFSNLASGKRGFPKTSMSLCIFIQPQVLLQELISLKSEDGLVDRFLFFPAKPVFHPTDKLKEGQENMSKHKMKDFTNMFVQMYEDHVEGIRYQLGTEAQRKYDFYVDSYANYIQEKYNSDSGNYIINLFKGTYNS